MEDEKKTPAERTAAQGRTEASLPASETRFDAIVASVTDYAIFMLDPHGPRRDLERRRRSASRATRPTRSSASTSRASTRRKTLRAAACPRTSSRWPRRDGPLRGRGLARPQGRHRASGRTSSSPPLRDDDGSLRGFAKVTRDLTRAARARGRSCGRARSGSACSSRACSDYAIFMLDPDGRVATWNAGAERIKGYTAEEIIGQHFSIFYPPEALARAAGPSTSCEVATRDGRFEDEGWRVRKDGTRFWANVVITALRDGRAAARLRQGHARPDRAQAGRGARARPRAREQLEAERTARMVPRATREGRVPRHAVARAAHAAERDPRLGAVLRTAERPSSAAPLDDRAQRARAGAADRRPARRLAHHVGQAAPRRRSRSTLDDVVQAAVDSVRPAARSQGRSGSRPCSTSSRRLGLRRRGAPAAGRLEPALERDQVHARRAAESRSRSQRVDSQRRDQRQRHRRGIDRRVPAARLRPLPSGRRRRPRASTAASGSGSPSCKHLVELHGGTVHAESEGEGAGRDLRRSPAADRAAARTTAAGARRDPRRRAEAAHGAASSARASLAGVRVLVVDDEADARELSRVVLEECRRRRAHGRVGRRGARRARRVATPTCSSPTSACPARTATS